MLAVAVQQLMLLRAALRSFQMDGAPVAARRRDPRPDTNRH